MKRDAEPALPARVELRKYPNRRYYDCTRSQHLTLHDIHRLVRDGVDVAVSDSKTGQDITAKVLAQIILEQDPPKLAVFPAELLHQVIRSNETLLEDFIERYFNRALSAFLKSQQEFDKYLGQMLGLYNVPAAGRGWAEMMMGPFLQAMLPASEERNGRRPAAPPRDPPEADADLRQTVESLKQQLAALREELKQR